MNTVAINVASSAVSRIPSTGACMRIFSAAAIGVAPFAMPAFAELEHPIACARCGCNLLQDAD